MSEADTTRSAPPNAPRQEEIVPGATGIFGTLPTPINPSDERETDEGPILSSRTERPEANLPPAVPLARATVSPPVVHEVTFQPQDEEAFGPDSSLHRLMQSLAPAKPTTTTSAESIGEFTQLLSALREDTRVTASSQPPLADGTGHGLHPEQHSGTDEGLSSTAKRAVGQQSLGREETSEKPQEQRREVQDLAEPSSFTRLFDALTPSTLPRETAAPAAPEAPHAALRHGAEKSSLPGMPAGRQEQAGVLPDAPASREPDAASFTQLFAALGQAPRTESSQAGDYPPLRPASAAAPQSVAKPVYAPAAEPVSHGVSGAADLQSLTQLLRALEAPAGEQASRSPLLPATGPTSGGAGSGATVAFTPPESVQRLAMQQSPQQAGPGEFTRILQASALRESGLGSQAASARRGPEPAPVSPDPSPAAAPALPPWATPPTPHAPSLPHLPQGGGSLPVVGVGPALHPAMPHASLQYPSMPHAAAPQAFVPAPDPLREHAPATGLSRPPVPWLTIVLLAVIVLLICVLVAVLLRR